MTEFRDDNADKSDREKIYSVGEFSKLTGLTERTLRYYDRKELLKPSGRNGQGHRYYRDGDLLQLQRIATLKYLNFSLEEIGEHLNESDQSLQESLEMQYELLLRKREQLDRVLATMERIRDIANNAGQVENALLLLFIHNIYHEDEQREQLAQFLPAPFLDTIFMRDKKEADKRELERKLTAEFVKLIRHYHDGRTPDDPQVLEDGSRLMDVLKVVLGDSLTKLNEQDLLKIAEMEDASVNQNPIFNQMWLSPDEEQFLGKVLELLDVQSLLIKEQSDNP
ncbi:MerR family transcriptional regulator [Paenibacillus sp. CAU 1782]